MARSSDPITEDEIWGTWEELLLACAVNRHGTHSWDAVATEVRSRSPSAHLLTADNCRQRYCLLKHRFSGAGGDGINGGEENDEGEQTVEIPWLDELRKLRVAELRREVQRYDVSIGSLQLKVKTLKEERERSLREPDEAGDGVNGSGSGSELKGKNDQQKDQPESQRSTPDKSAGGRISGEDSGRSCKESNSTEPKAEEVKVEEGIKEVTDPAVNGSRSGSGSGPVAGAAASFNGSSDTIAKGAVRSPALERNQAVHESGESVAESKGGDEEEGTKESSDVQSSASLSRRGRGGRRRRGTASAVEPETGAVSPVRKAVDAESKPLIAFLETIRSNKDGSVFDRRLESQILQHPRGKRGIEELNYQGIFGGLGEDYPKINLEPSRWGQSSKREGTLHLDVYKAPSRDPYIPEEELSRDETGGQRYNRGSMIWPRKRGFGRGSAAFSWIYGWILATIPPVSCSPSLCSL